MLPSRVSNFKNLKNSLLYLVFHCMYTHAQRYCTYWLKHTSNSHSVRTYFWFVAHFTASFSPENYPCYMLFMCKQGTQTDRHTHMHPVHTADSSSLYILIVLSVSAHSNLHPLLSKQQANIPASLSSDPGWTVVCNFWKQYPLFQSQKYIEPLSAVKEEKKQIILHDSHHVENFEVIRLYVLK